jgi:hypothetical protein
VVVKSTVSNCDVFDSEVSIIILGVSLGMVLATLPTSPRLGSAIVAVVRG